MSDEQTPRRWTDPRYRNLVATWDAITVERPPGQRLRRTCPHGQGVTMLVDLATQAHRNVRCEECSS